MWIGTHQQQLLPWELGNCFVFQVTKLRVVQLWSRAGIMNCSFCAASHTPLGPAEQGGDLPSSLLLPKLEREKEFLIARGKNINFQACSVDVFQRKA